MHLHAHGSAGANHPHRRGHASDSSGHRGESGGSAVGLHRVFAAGVALNVLYVAVEAGFGIAVHSLALLADAGHNLSDVLGLLLAWGASYLSRRPPSQRYSYGLRSSTILAATLNSLLLLTVVGGIAWEAIQRLASPDSVSSTTIMLVAAIGAVVNTATALLFLRGGQSDLNVRGAFLHMAADAGVSLAVVLAGLAIYFTGRAWIDPAISLVVAGVILWNTWGLLRESVELLLQAVPRNVDPAEVVAYLRSLPGVESVHDVHIWAMSTTENSLTAHLVRPSLDDNDALLHDAASELRRRFGIHHVTLQIEQGDPEHTCLQAPDDIV